MPGCGIRANDKTIVSHLLPVKFLVRQEAFKVKFKGSLSFEFKKAWWRTQNFTDEWWRDGEVFIELARTRGRDGGAMKFAPIAAAPET